MFRKPPFNSRLRVVYIYGQYNMNIRHVYVYTDVHGNKHGKNIIVRYLCCYLRLQLCAVICGNARPTHPENCGSYTFFLKMQGPNVSLRFRQKVIKIAG